MEDVTLEDFSKFGQAVLRRAFSFQADGGENINGDLKSEAGNFYAQIFLIQAGLIYESLKLRHGRALKLDNIDDPSFDLIYLFEDRSMLSGSNSNNWKFEVISRLVDDIYDNLIISVEFERFFGKPWSPDKERKLADAAEHEANEKARLFRISQKRSEKMRAYWFQKKRDHPEEIRILNQNRSEWMKRYWSQRKAATY